MRTSIFFEMNTYRLHPESIRSLFNNIAPTYDLANHLLSLGRDFYSGALGSNLYP